MASPVGHLNFAFDADKGGWVIGATGWSGQGDYKGPLTTDAAIELLIHGTLDASIKSASVWVLGQQIYDNIAPNRALAVLQSFPRGAEAVMTRARAEIAAWRPWR